MTYAVNSVGLSVGKDKNPSMNGLDYCSDNDSSVTCVGITDIAVIKALQEITAQDM